AINWDMSNDVGSGALYSTVEDLFRWNEALFGSHVLDDASLKAAFTPVSTRADATLSRPKESGYGYGWTIFRARGLPVIEHGGSLDGFQSNLRRFPDQRFTVVVLVNAKPAPPALDPANLAQEIAQLYLWREIQPRNVPEPLRTLRPEGFDAFLGRYDYGWNVLTLSREGKRFFAQLQGQDKQEVYPAATNRFAWKTFEAEIEFIRKPAGEVVGTFRNNGYSFSAPRQTPRPAVYFSGAFTKTGAYAWTNGMTLQDGIEVAGGFTPWANGTLRLIRRDGSQELYRLGWGRTLTNNPALQPEDIVLSRGQWDGF
ncbi:MAG TPA: serine hydrolase, partial [Bacillota bacterium]|nr:serine hydrolase [Bacillota bacterium]